MQEKEVDIKRNILLSKIKKVVAEFVRGEQGRISKQSVLTIGTTLTTLGLAEIASASHACAPPVDYGGGGGDGGGDGGSGGGGGGCCFASDQLVLTPEGLKEISKIEVDSKVVSYDEKTDTFTTSTVGSAIIHDGNKAKMNNFSKDRLLNLSVMINEKLYETKVTENHPYFDPINKIYKPLREFKVGDMIKAIESNGIIVNKLSILDGSSPANEHNEVVYNLHMREGPNNYIINGTVVHNGCGK